MIHKGAPVHSTSCARPPAPLERLILSDPSAAASRSALPPTFPVLDVAFIRPDGKASVKLTAYDYLIYGALEGRIERISADTITDERGERFYRVIVRTDQNHLKTAKGELPIIPGMVATVDIQTGEKTVLDYLLKPIRRGQKEALRER